MWFTVCVCVQMCEHVRARSVAVWASEFCSKLLYYQEVQVVILSPSVYGSVCSCNPFCSRRFNCRSCFI